MNYDTVNLYRLTSLNEKTLIKYYILLKKLVFIIGKLYHTSHDWPQYARLER